MKKTTLVALLALAACSEKTRTIDDPSMQATATQLGSSSGQLSTMPADADQNTIQSQTQGVGSNLQSLVSQHQAYASANPTTAPEVDGDGLQQDTTGTVTWDGTHLVVDTSYDAEGTSFDYDVDLTFTQGAEGTTIDGRFDMAYLLDIIGISYDYTTKGSYDGLLIDGSGCAVGGSITVDWSFDYDVAGFGLPGATAGASDGLVTVTYAGCNVVTIEGT